MSDYQQAARRIHAWLDAHFEADGTGKDAPDDSRLHVKAPYLLTMAGLRAKAARVSKRAGERFLTANGDLIPSPGTPAEIQIYSLGWVALGAAIAERFEVAERAAGRLASLLDPATGAIYLPDNDAGTEVAEAQCLGGAMMGLVAARHLDPARRIADGLAQLLDAQPDPARFYNRIRRDGTVVAKQAAGAWHKMYDPQVDEQRPANYAPGVIGLVWLSRATGNTQYRDTAARYVEMVYRHSMDPARFGRSTKFGWAMLQLYEDTGDPRLLELASRLGDVLVSLQSDDGLWDPRPGPELNTPPSTRLSYSSDCAMTVLSLANLPR